MSTFITDGEGAFNARGHKGSYEIGFISVATL
jgi:hypothetical protein